MFSVGTSRSKHRCNGTWRFKSMPRIRLAFVMLGVWVTLLFSSQFNITAPNTSTVQFTIFGASLWWPRLSLVVESEVVTAVLMKRPVFGDITSYSALKNSLHVPPKRRVMFNGLYGVISQKFDLLSLVGWWWRYGWCVTCCAGVWLSPW
jgi:hypothetical protein